MKCLLITSIFPPIHGGSAVVYENIARFNPPASIHILAPWRNYQDGEILEGWKELDKKARYPVHRVELIRPPMIKTHSILHSLWIFLTFDLKIRFNVFRKVVHLVRRENINIICIGELETASWIGVLAKRWLGCKVINYIHGEEITSDTPYRFFKNRRQHYLRNADAIVAVSEFTQQALIEQMQIDPKKIELIMNGVNLNIFRVKPKEQQLIDRYQLNGKKIILSVGRLVPRKGFDHTIKALPAILEKCPEAMYLLVGTGEYRDELERLAKEYGVTNHVIFAGRVSEEELTDHYNLCDIFVMPNRELANHDTEGFGLVFLEANACGKAVVGGRAGGAVEAVRDGQNGLLVHGENIDEIAKAITKLLTDKEYREKIERQGLAIARASSSEIRANQFYKLCLNLSKKEFSSYEHT
jgi:phosphatidylinositol alpha-1,6-mannosyltransferase